MAAKARITSDFPSAKEVASQLKIPSDRVAQLRKELHDLHIVRSDSKTGDARKDEKSDRARDSKK
jgi:hypothetical protein